MEVPNRKEREGGREWINTCLVLLEKRAVIRKELRLGERFDWKF